MAYLNKIYVFIGIGVLIMALGSDGDITTSPTNKAVLIGTSNFTMSCASSLGYSFLAWSYVPVGDAPPSVTISSGSTVVQQQRPYYAVEQSGDNMINLIILNATTTRAGTYSCSEGTNQQSAQLIIINSDPVCSMTPNAPTELLFNQTVRMSCSITYTANSYVAVDMIWSKNNSAIIVSNAPPNTTTSASLTTATSTITQTPGYSSPFPIYRCNTTFKITGNPNGSANNAPDYSKSTQLNSSIRVIYIKPASPSSITGTVGNGDEVYLGNNLTCTVEGNPTPSYSWLDVTYGNTTNSQTIQIWHEGDYQCTAWNTAGSTSVSINVTITITTTTSTTTTTTTPTTTVTSQSTSSGGGDKTASQEASASNGSGLSETQKIIIGVVVGVGGALLIAAVAIVIYCCLKKKNKADRYSSGSEGTLSKSAAPPPYDDNGHRGPQRSSNPDIVQGYQMDDYPKNFSPYSTAGEHQNKPYVEDEGLNYAQIQLDNNPRSRQPLQVAPQETNYSEVRLA